MREGSWGRSSSFGVVAAQIVDLEALLALLPPSSLNIIRKRGSMILMAPGRLFEVRERVMAVDARPGKTMFTPMCSGSSSDLGLDVRVMVSRLC